MGFRSRGKIKEVADIGSLLPDDRKKARDLRCLSCLPGPPARTSHYSVSFRAGIVKICRGTRIWRQDRLRNISYIREETEAACIGSTCT